jgi:formate dehydrogenase maturation protein FdhE
MESNCPTCGSNVVQILIGTRGSRYVMCMGCQQIAPVQRVASPAQEPSEREQLPSARQYQPPTGILS